MNLPATREESWRFYSWVQKRAMASDDKQAWWKAERALGRGDLFYLLVRILRRPDLNRCWLFERCREVQADPDGCLDLWARGHYKSTIITFGLTIQDILNNPELTIAILSHTRPIAKGFLVQIKRELEDSPILKWLYPDVCYEVPHRDSPRWGEEAGIVVRRKGNPKESTIEAWGLIDSQPTSRHFDILIFDDVVTRENVTTPDQVHKTTEALELSMNLTAQNGRMRYIGTRYSLFDTYSALLERNAAKPRLYPATHNGKFDGRPVLFSAEEWRDKLRDMSRTTIAAQLLQNPLADSDATFRTEWLRSYEVRPRTMNVFITADPSRGRSATSDNTAIAVIGIAAGGAKFLLDGACHRMTLSQRWIALRNLRRKWSAARGVQHIAVGYERYGAQSDDEYFAEQMDLDAKKGIKDSHFTIAELNWPREGGNSKKDRVERLEPDFRNGRFYLPLPVWRDGKPAMWRVDVDPDSKTFGDIEYRELGLTRAQMDAVEGGSADLVAKAIRCVDQDGKMYDLTLKFIEEYSSFPFGKWDDLCDSASRIYDLSPTAPTLTRPEMLEPVEHWDR